MRGVSVRERTEWRNEFARRIKQRELNERVVVFNPILWYDSEDSAQRKENEFFRYDIRNLKRSDLVVANIDTQRSIETCMEIAIAHDNEIPVVALYTKTSLVNTWIDECCIRICNSMDELVEYVADYYLV